MISEPISAEPSPDQEAVMTIAAQRSSRRERRWALALAGFLGAISIVVVPFHLAAFPVERSFIPAFAWSTAIADLLAAALLFGLYKVDGMRGLERLVLHLSVGRLSNFLIAAVCTASYRRWLHTLIAHCVELPTVFNDRAITSFDFES